ncbi:hypothetical protein [Humisphaera borealis]|uniref:Uncharacterized protein n=1 Tax=Humisphaera borealis TaxID=2807512 RepID=A0A7M2WWC7_9BACT|nr:hypothetical protein [Humisphaera borealis]QOV88810.1 hypothetical protein IPV69_21685 [Humisphaera borealis]
MHDLNGRALWPSYNDGMRWLKAVAICVLVLLAYLVGRISTFNKDLEAIQQVVAISWSDGTRGQTPAFYGAEVYATPDGTEYVVRTRVWIGRSPYYYHDPLGELGRVKTWEEAVAKWGNIQWTSTDLVIGPGDPTPKSFARSGIENHR